MCRAAASGTSVGGFDMVGVSVGYVAQFSGVTSRSVKTADRISTASESVGGADGTASESVGGAAGTSSAAEPQLRSAQRSMLQKLACNICEM